MDFETWWDEYVKKYGLEGHNCLALLKETAYNVWLSRQPRVEYINNGVVVDRPTIFELACKYAGLYGIQYDTYRIVM